MAERFTRRGDPGLQGRVSGRNGDSWHVEREQELLDVLAGPGREIVADTTDHYSGRGRFDEGTDVSLENAAAYDEGLSDYAAGQDITGQKGVVPCDLVGRPRDPKKGASGRRVWHR